MPNPFREPEPNEYLKSRPRPVPQSSEQTPEQLADRLLFWAAKRVMLGILIIAVISLFIKLVNQ